MEDEVSFVLITRESGITARIDLKNTEGTFPRIVLRTVPSRLGQRAETQLDIFPGSFGRFLPPYDSQRAKAFPSGEEPPDCFGHRWIAAARRLRHPFLEKSQGAVWLDTRSLAPAVHAKEVPGLQVFGSGTHIQGSMLADQWPRAADSKTAGGGGARTGALAGSPSAGKLPCRFNSVN